MNADSNRDQEALYGAVFDAYAAASQEPNNLMFGREHAPSGFEIETNLDDLIESMARRSSVAGKQDGEGSDDDYVKLS